MILMEVNSLSLNLTYFNAYNQQLSENKRVAQRNNQIKQQCVKLTEQIKQLDTDIQQAKCQNNQLHKVRGGR